MYNIFHTPHKAWRAALAELRTRVKNTDFTDVIQCNSTAHFAKCVFTAHHAHTESENKVLGPALKRPELAEHWIDVHGMHGCSVQVIKDDLEQLQKASQNPSKRVSIGSKLGDDLENFTAQDNMHTRLEEGFMEYYRRMYNEQELFDLDVKATTYWTEINDDAKEQILPFFIRAHKSEDIGRILMIFKQIYNTKPESWKRFVDMAKREMTPSQVSKYEDKLL